MLRPQNQLLRNKVSPLRSETIAMIAQEIRNVFTERFFDGSYINMLKVLQFLYDYGYIILEIPHKTEMPNEFGLTVLRPDKGVTVVKIREDIYEAAYKNDPKARFIIAHEIGHYFLHSKSTPEFAFAQTQSNHCVTEDAEWQANQFAKFFLVDFTHPEKYSTPLAVTKNFGIHSGLAYEVYEEMKNLDLESTR